MKKIILLIFVFVSIIYSCSSDGEDDGIVTYDGPKDEPAPKVIEKYNLLFKKNYHNLFDASIYSPFGNNASNGFFGDHKSVDTLLIDLSKEGNGFIPPSTKGAYEYVNYIKVLNYTNYQNQKKVYVGNFNLSDCVPNSFYKNCEPNGVYYRMGNDRVGFNKSNISEEQLNNLLYLSRNPGSDIEIKFFEKIEDTTHYWHEFSIYKQPFDQIFPNGLKVGDVINYQTVIRYSSSSQYTVQKLPCTVIKVEPVYKN